MDDLRPENDEQAFEDDEAPPELDEDIVDRLSAYAPDEGPEEGNGADVAEARLRSWSPWERHDRAVENGPAAEHAAETGDEPDEPGEEQSDPGSYETEREEFALPDADLAEPGLFAAELSAFDLEPEPEDAVEGEPDSGHLEPSADVDEHLEPEHLEPEHLEPGELVMEGEVVAPEVAEDAVAHETQETEEAGALEEADERAQDELPIAEAAHVEEAAPSRRSLVRRRSERAEKPEKEKKEKKARAPREKRGAKDRKVKRLVGLKIGASQIAAAQIANNGAPELVEVFREPLEPGLVVSGEIRDPEALGVALRRLFDLHKLPKRGVRLGLSNNRIGVRSFEIEGVTDEQQLDNAIRFRAEEVLPIPLDQAVLDYVVLEDAVREDGTPWKRILLVVAYREVVDRYLQACSAAGLEVVGIDLEAFALLRAVEAPTDRDQQSGALVAVAIGHDRTTIAVSTGRHCEFTRVLDWGGWSLNVAIARELDRAPSEVEGLKRQLSFASTTDIEGFTPEQVSKARDAIQRSLAAFVRELVASLQFYQAQPGALGIGEVVLTGGAAHMDGLPEALGELVGVPIRLGDPFKRVKVGPNVAHDGPRGSLSVAIGLGIED
jgi:type IV pilus assembly protein PilM